MEAPRAGESNPRRSILAEAAAAVDGDRQRDYGSPAENHGRTAALWSAYLQTSISAADVCALNILQKLSRERYRAKRDNLVDVAGYAENLDRIRQAQAQAKARLFVDGDGDPC